MTDVYIDARLRDWMVELASVGAPREVVGLVTAPTAPAELDVIDYDLWPLHNSSPEPERTFRVEEAVLRDEVALLAEQAMMPVAMYHSHVSRQAAPSETDIARAIWPHHFIVAPAARPGRQVRFWHIADGAAAERRVVVV